MSIKCTLIIESNRHLNADQVALFEKKYSGYNTVRGADCITYVAGGLLKRVLKSGTS